MEIKTLDKALETDPISELLTQGESGVDRFTFRIPRYYYGTDLSGFTFRLRGISDKNTIAETYLTESAENEELLLEWLVTPEFTAVAGRIKLELSVISPDQSQILKLTSREIKIRESLWGSVPPESASTFEKSLLDIAALQKSSLQKSQLHAGQGVLITNSGKDIIISCSGGIDDENPTSYTSYSSQKLEEEFLRRGETTDGSATKAYVDAELSKLLSYSSYDPQKTGTVNSAHKVIPLKITADASNRKLLSDIISEGEYICQSSGEAQYFTDKPWASYSFVLSVKFVRLNAATAGVGTYDPAIRQEFTGFHPTAQKCPYVRYLHWNPTSSVWTVGSWQPVYDGFQPPTAEDVKALPLTRLGYKQNGNVPYIQDNNINAPQIISLHNPVKEASVPMLYTSRLFAHEDGSLFLYLADGSKTEHKFAGFHRFLPNGGHMYYDADKQLHYNFYGDLYKPYVIGYYTGTGGNQLINIGFQPSAVFIDGDFAINKGELSGGYDISISSVGFAVSGSKSSTAVSHHIYIALR